MTRSFPRRTLWLVPVLLLAPAVGAGEPAARTDSQGDPLPRGAVRRLGTVRFRHGDGICATAFSADGRLLASLSRDRTVRLWESATGREIRQFREADCEYYSIAFAPDGRLLAAAGGDPLQGGNTAIRLWDTATGKEVRRLEGHQQPAYTLAFSPDGTTLVSVSCNQVIRWDTASGRQLSQWKELRSTASLAVAPDRRALATVGGETEDKSIHLWDAATGKAIGCLRGHQRGVVSVAYAPDGKTLASANPFEPIRLWDVAAGKVLRQFGEPHGGMALAFSPDGKTLASACLSGAVRLWDVATGKVVRSLRGYQGWVNGLAFSPDGKALALAGADAETLHLWEVASGRDLRPQCGHRGHVHAVAFAPDGGLLASAGGDRQGQDTAIRVWEPATGRELRLLEGHADTVHCLAFAPDGTRSGGSSVLLASGGEREDFVRLWDAGSGTCVRQLRPTRGKGEEAPSDRRVSAVAFSRDGTLLAAGLDEGLLVVWDVTSGAERRRLVGHEGRITSLAFSPDGARLASGSLDRSVRLWDLAGGKEVRTFGKHEDTIRTVAFSPDGRLLAAGAGDWEGVWLWEAATGKEVGRIAVGDARLYHLAFAPDGRTLAVGCAGRGLRLWEVATRKERRCLPGHAGGVHALAFSPDGRTLASGSKDSTVLLWDVHTAEGAAPGLTQARLEELWADLSAEDACRADRAIRALLAAPEQAVPFLTGRLRPLPVLSPERQAEIVRDLDHSRYRVRDRATSELARLGELAEPLLRRKLIEAPSLEVRQRVRMLLDRLDTATLSAANLQALRAFEVLERIGTAAVRPVFEAHAREAPAARLGLEARASLERLARREH